MAPHLISCKSANKDGNILFAILIAVVLMGALTAVLSKGFIGGKDISTEDMDAKAQKILRYSESVKNAVNLLYTQKGLSETDFLFAHPKNDTSYGDSVSTTPSKQVFSIEGGGASFMWPLPDGINDGSPWEFTGRTKAPNVGEDGNQDLMMYLPRVTEKFCRSINKNMGYNYTDAIPVDSSGCGFSTTLRWTNTYGATNNTISNDYVASGILTPANALCVQCETDSSYNFYYVLLAR